MKLSTELMGQRLVFDSVHAVGGILNVEINSRMLASCRAARREYQSYLDEKNKASEDINKCQTEQKQAKIELKKHENKKRHLLEELQSHEESIKKFKKVVKKKQ